MRKKVLFDYAERFTELGDTLYTRIAEALRPIYQDAESNNVKLREVSHVVSLTAGMLEVEGILARDVTHLKERWVTAKPGVVPPSAPRIHGGR